MSDICKCGSDRHPDFHRVDCPKHKANQQPAPTGVEESDVKCTSIQSTAIAATAPHSGNSAPAPPAPDAGAVSEKGKVVYRGWALIDKGRDESFPTIVTLPNVTSREQARGFLTEFSDFEAAHLIITKSE